MNLSEKSLASFAGDLSRRTPVPGGGGAAAYAGALSAALVSMCAAFTRPKDEAVASPELDAIVARSREVTGELTSLVDADAAAYAALRDAYALEDEAARTAAIEDAVRRATDVPLRIMREAAAVVEIADGFESACKEALVSDLGAAATLAAASLEAASFFVWVNLDYVADSSARDAIARECDGLLEGYVERGRAVAARVAKRIGR